MNNPFCGRIVVDIVEQEEWRAIPGFEGYEASNFGRIRSIDRICITDRCPNGRFRRGYILRHRITKDGYARLEVAGKMASVHRLIAVTFIGPIPSDRQINHKDGVKLNNRPGNLEIVTGGENIKHAFNTGLKKPPRGELSGLSKITVESAKRIREITGRSVRDIAAEFGISNQQVSKIRTGKRWAHLVGTAGNS